MRDEALHVYYVPRPEQADAPEWRPKEHLGLDIESGVAYESENQTLKLWHLGPSFGIDQPILKGGRNISHFEPLATEPELEETLDAIIDAYERLEPRYAFGMPTPHVQVIEIDIPQSIPSPISPAGLATGRIDWPTVLMLFPPPMVKTYGEDWLRNLPVERIEPLPDGGLLVLVSEQLGDLHGLEERMEPVEEAFKSHPHNPVNE